MDLKKVYKDNNIVITGHTGFKGSWLCLWLAQLGAEVHGFSLPPNTEPNHSTAARISKLLKSEKLGDIREIIELHTSHGKLATMTSVQPEGRFCALVSTPNGEITSFLEKPTGDGSWINAGFFVFEPEIFDYIKEGDATIFERTPLTQLAKDGQLCTYKHYGFWKCMDTLRDKLQLQDMYDAENTLWLRN